MKTRAQLFADSERPHFEVSWNDPTKVNPKASDDRVRIAEVTDLGELRVLVTNIPDRHVKGFCAWLNATFILPAVGPS